MNKWRLPASLNLGGADFAIRTDYRIILGIFRVLNDDGYDDVEKWAIAIRAFYIGDVPDANEAIAQMITFFNGGTPQDDDDVKKPKLMDWEQDVDLLIPAINHAAGYDVRGVDYLHWWTFLSYYLSIDENCTFNMVYWIRKKMANGEKLEQHEREYVRDNPKVVFLRDAERIRQDEEDRKALAEIGL